ncbi:hypothetical protein, partial [Rodentibacter trehalosifermentans]|uniref:hypothetical protein n=1 Tax=Rodentibacter trehalosifermentans TaxID=1908263 RepID=UPI001AC0073C
NLRQPHIFCIVLFFQEYSDTIPKPLAIPEPTISVLICFSVAPGLLTSYTKSTATLFNACAPGFNFERRGTLIASLTPS